MVPLVRVFIILASIQGVPACDGDGPKQPGAPVAVQPGSVAPPRTSGQAPSPFERTTWGTTPWARVNGYTVQGVVRPVNPSTGQFAVDGLPVVLARPLIAELPFAASDIGRTLTVRGRARTSDGALIAESVLLHDPGLSSGELVAFGEAGLVDREEGFDVIGYRVIATPDVELSQGIEYFAYLKVVGRFDGNALYPDELVVLGNGPPYFLGGMIEAIDVAASKITVLGMELSLHEWTQQRTTARGPSLGDLAVGDQIGVELHQNRFVVDFRSADWLVGQSLVVGAYFRSLAPPSQFTLYGFADMLVHVDAVTRFYHDWASSNDIGPGAWSGACDPAEIPAESFWAIAERPKPPEITYAIAQGRFEGGILLAQRVTLCGGAP